MAGVALVTIAVGGAAAIGGGIYLADQNRRAANEAADAATRQAQQAEERAKEEERIAKEQRDFEIGLAKEQLAFETGKQIEKGEFTKEQVRKRDAEVIAAAIAGYAASGIDIEGRSSSLAVINRLRKESTTTIKAIGADVQSFIEARKLEFKQLSESKSLTFDWFVSRLHRETKWEVTNRLAEASAYRSKARAASIGGAFDVLGTAMSYGTQGALTYEKYYG